jgi:hypothetical protein
VTGVAEHQHLTEDDAEADNLMFNNLSPHLAGMKMEEKLEQLMQPGAEVLQLTMTVGPAKNKTGTKQKTKLLQLLDQYVLLTTQVLIWTKG